MNPFWDILVRNTDDYNGYINGLLKIGGDFVVRAIGKDERPEIEAEIRQIHYAAFRIAWSDAILSDLTDNAETVTNPSPDYALRAKGDPVRRVQRYHGEYVDTTYMPGPGR